MHCAAVQSALAAVAAQLLPAALTHACIPESAPQRSREASPVRPQPLEQRRTPAGQLHIDPFTLESYISLALNPKGFKFD